METISSLNYIITSSGWRQDHNGFSHQNPGFIDDILRRHSNFSNVYFPADANTALVVVERMLREHPSDQRHSSRQTLEPRWLTVQAAREQVHEGLLVWDFASDENPDVVMAAAGDYLTKETMAAIDIVN